MPDWLVDALYYGLRFIGVLIALDVLVLLFMWRVSSHRRRIARREKMQKLNHKSTDDWFSEAAQKELYRDFAV